VCVYLALINGEVREVTASMETEIVVKELSSACFHNATKTIPTKPNLVYEGTEAHWYTMKTPK